MLNHKTYCLERTLFRHAQTKTLYSIHYMEEIINCENGVLVEPASERELCEKILLLLESEEMRSDIGEKARETKKEYEKLCV